MSIFKWESLQEIGPHDLNYAKVVAGKEYEIELSSGRRILVWRANDLQSYFCHGLTFGGTEAPGGRFPHSQANQLK
jgi:hypothetical protein